MSASSLSLRTRQGFTRILALKIIYSINLAYRFPMITDSLCKMKLAENLYLSSSLWKSAS